MTSSSGVACLEVFDENSQPSAEEISEYAQQIGIDPESETHLLPLAKDGLMQALPPPWKAYYDEKLHTHYYYNEETKKTQWDHPLDNVYREMVQKARDASMLDDTYVSVQELLTSEENTKHLERVETKVESDDDLSIDTIDSGPKEPPPNIPRRLAPLGRPPLAPISTKKMNDFRISPLRKSVDGAFKPTQKGLFKHNSEIIDLKMHVLNSPDEDSFNLFGKGERVLKLGLPLTGKGSMFLKGTKSDLPSPDTEKSLNLDSITKSDPPKGILREKISDSFHRKVESLSLSKPRQTTSFEEDRKSVRFQLENSVEPTISPGSNSSSEQHDGQSSIISATPSLPRPNVPSNLPITSSNAPTPASNVPIVLSPIRSLRPQNSLDQMLSPKDRSSGSDKESVDAISSSPGRRLLRPPAADYINPELFQKNFRKITDVISDAAEGGEGGTARGEGKEARPRSPMIPQVNKISINLMESIDSETSIDSPDRDFDNFDLNDLDDDKQPSNKEDKKDTINSDTNHSSDSPKTPKNDTSIPNLKSPKSEDAKRSSDSKFNYSADSLDSNRNPEPKLFSPTKLFSPNHSFNSDRSPKSESERRSFKPGTKPQIKSSDSNSSVKGLSPRLDGVVISQGKTLNRGSDDVVVMYQFEQREALTKPKSSSEIARDMTERSKADEKRRLELSLQKQLEEIRVEWTVRERKMRAELQEELRENEVRFKEEKRKRLMEQEERQRLELEEAIKQCRAEHEAALNKALQEMAEQHKKDINSAKEKYKEDLLQVVRDHETQISEKRCELEREIEQNTSELVQQSQTEFVRVRDALLSEHRSVLDTLRDEHRAKVEELKHDYRAEMETLRSAHHCHVSEVRARLARQRAAPAPPAPPPPAHDLHLQDKYKCLKQKYARLKHDVKMSIERRNKRREMSMTTGSETEKSNSHRTTHNLEKKEASDPGVTLDVSTERARDCETSVSDCHPQRLDNNYLEWNANKPQLQSVISGEGSNSEVRRKRTTVVFKDPPKQRRGKTANRDKLDGTTTDFQDSSDATTTADERPKESKNGHGRRRCFTRLKSASTSRLNYSPKRGEGWSSPLECLRQQLRKLDDLEEQFPDLACQPSYSLRYPFAELGAVTSADSPELEFVRHRALIEREEMRRARAALRRHRDHIRTNRDQSREMTELEVALHRARSLLGEKEIRLQHIERALRTLPTNNNTKHSQEPTSSASSSGSERGGSGAGGGAGGGGEAGGGGGGGVLRSLRALHDDVRDIWRALDARRLTNVSPESSSCNTANQPTMSLSAHDAPRATEDSLNERARGLRAWLHTAP